MRTTKKTTKMIAAVMAALTAGTMAVAAAAPTASAGEYFTPNGVFYDGINDGRVYETDIFGNVYDVTYAYGYDATYIGYDAYYGNIYYRADIGYFAYNGGDNYLPLGWSYIIY